jgi:hypothetical protein
MRNGVVVATTTATSYGMSCYYVGAADVGATITATATANKAGYSPYPKPFSPNSQTSITIQP